MNKDTLAEEKTLELLKELTIQDFLDVGLNQVAYIKCADDKSFSVYAADGSQISVMESYDMAVESIRGMIYSQ